MDGVRSEGEYDDVRSVEKSYNGNLSDEMEEQFEMEDFEQEGDNENFETILLGVAGNAHEESNLVNEGEMEKENMNDCDKTNRSVAIKPVQLNGEESVSGVGEQEKEEILKESDTVVRYEDEKLNVGGGLNAMENDKDPVVHEEDVNKQVKSEGQSQVGVVSKKKKRKFIKRKKKIAAKRANEGTVKDTDGEEPLNNNNHQKLEETNNKNNDDDNHRTVDELNNKDNDGNQVARTDGSKEVKNEQQIQGTSKKKTGKLRKKERMQLKKKKALKGRNDQEASNKMLPSKAKIAGMIFMCSSKTKDDCYRYKVLGLPSSKRDVVLKIYQGMKLFLFDVDLKLLYGIYRAAGPGGYNIEPKAFNSAFPSQVRFNVFEDCLPQPEEKFKKAIKDNYYKKNKFDCQLTPAQVKNLCKLFQAGRKGSRSKGLRRDHGAQADKPSPPPPCESRISIDRDWSRKRHWESENYRFEDWDRSSKRYRDPYEMEAYGSRLHPASSRPLPQSRPALASPLQSFAYERTLETNATYRRDAQVGFQDRQIRDMELRPREQFELGKYSFHRHSDRAFRDSEFRHRREINHDSHLDKERLELRLLGEIDHDPYSYRDRPVYHDRSYSSTQPAEYHFQPRTSPRRVTLPPTSGLFDRYLSRRSWY